MKGTEQNQLNIINTNCRGESFDFTRETKEGYLEFRAAWRAEYRRLSEMIGSCRRAFRRRRRSEDGFERWRSRRPVT